MKTVLDPPVHQYKTISLEVCEYWLGAGSDGSKFLSGLARNRRRNLYACSVEFCLENLDQSS